VTAFLSILGNTLSHGLLLGAVPFVLLLPLVGGPIATAFGLERSIA
jgi:hypothetical protein